MLYQEGKMWMKAFNFIIFDMNYVYVKSPMFSFGRLSETDLVLRE